MTSTLEISDLPPAIGLAREVELAQRGGTRLCRLYPSTGGDPAGWFTANAATLASLMDTYGAVMVKRSGLSTQEQLTAAAEAIGGGPTLEYTERSTPRSRVSGNVYTSTEYPADQTIPQHNESAYSEQYPDNVFFHCALAARSGGETPVADSEAVLRALPGDLVERFRAHGVLYTRTYHAGIGLPWQEVFQTDDRGQVERYCAEHGIQTEWDGSLLRTRQVRPALATHPRTGRTVWFNQAHLFHVGALQPSVRDGLLELFSERDLPRNAYVGDGSPISEAELAAINAAFAAATLAEPWATGDVLMIDNLLVSHGRRPYEGDRRVLVAMTKRS